MTVLRVIDRAPRGITLVEVLVAITVLAIGFLGIVALQVQGVRQNVDSYARSQAVTLANDYVERIYANKPAADAGDYGVNHNTDGTQIASENFDSGDPAGANPCTAATPPATQPDLVCATQSDQTTPDVCTPAQMAAYDQFIVTCGYRTPTDGVRYGGVRDLLQAGRIQVDCLDTATPPAVITVAPLCPLGARHRITVSWQEQVKGANNLTTWQGASYQMTVRP